MPTLKDLLTEKDTSEKITIEQISKVVKEAINNFDADADLDPDDVLEGLADEIIDKIDHEMRILDCYNGVKK